jgi:hypothetical protein
VGKKLYEALASGIPVFDEKVLDDWGTSINELQKTAPQLFDASKKVNGFIFGLVGNRELANESKSWISFLLSLAIKSVQSHLAKGKIPAVSPIMTSLYSPTNFEPITPPK